MICRKCAFDLRHINMIALWEGTQKRTLSLILACPNCGSEYAMTAVPESKFTNANTQEALCKPLSQ
jgi:hypothetical protein